MDECSSLERLLRTWRSQPEVSENIVEWHIDPERAAEWADFPSTLHTSVVLSLR
jgi:hypothetical protein